MALADSVTVFSEGTFEEQVQELVNYLARGLSTEDRIAYIKPYQDILLTPEGAKPIAEDAERKQKTLQMVVDGVKGLGEGNDRESEGFFNLLFAHLLSLYSPSSPDLASQLSKLVTSIAADSSHAAAIKYRILTNLFNAAPRTSSVRLQAYKTLVQLTASNGDLGLLQVWRSDLEGWVDEWDVEADEKIEFLEQLSEAYEKAGLQEDAYTFTVRRLALVPPHSPLALQASLTAISKALSLPFVYSFDPIVSCLAVGTARDHPLYALFRIFWTGGVQEWTTWTEADGHAAVLEEFGLNKSALESKIRLLTLASLASHHLAPGSEELTYTLIASRLSVPESEVEQWVMSAIGANLLSGKLSQPTHTFRVYRAAVRTFETAEWEQLEERATAWRDGLVGVLSVLKAKRQAAQPMPEAKVVVNGVGAGPGSEGVTVEASA